VSVIQQPDVKGKGYRVAGGVKAWNTVQGNVHLWNKVVPGCGVVDVGLFATGTCPVLEGNCDAYVDWPRWQEGAWDFSTDKYTYHHSILRLSYDPAMTRWPRCKARYVMAHELGHTLGLPHSTSTTSVMSYAYDWVNLCGAPDAADVAAVASLYTPVG
jgi:hypothetical protein